MGKDSSLVSLGERLAVHVVRGPVVAVVCLLAANFVDAVVGNINLVAGIRTERALLDGAVHTFVDASGVVVERWLVEEVAAEQVRSLIFESSFDEIPCSFLEGLFEFPVLVASG